LIDHLRAIERTNDQRGASVINGGYSANVLEYVIDGDDAAIDAAHDILDDINCEFAPVVGVTCNSLVIEGMQVLIGTHERVFDEQSWPNDASEELILNDRTIEQSSNVSSVLT